MATSFKPTTTRPDDFDAYWDEVVKELDALPLAPEVEELPQRETDYSKMYAVRYTGIGPYRLFGYLSLPKGEGPFPTLVYLPKYQSVLEVIPQGDASEKRRRFAMFSAAARGQRNADRPYAASFPGLFLDGIEDAQKYVFRGFVADSCRALDYVLTRPEVDQSRLMGLGDETALMAAALRRGFTHLLANPTFFYAAMDITPQTQAYPRQEVNDYLRLHPERREQIARTLSYFEPLFFAPKVEVEMLLCGDVDALGPLAQALAGAAELCPITGSGYTDGLYKEQWLSHKLGFDDAIVPAHWQ